MFFRRKSILRTNFEVLYCRQLSGVKNSTPGNLSTHYLCRLGFLGLPVIELARSFTGGAPELDREQQSSVHL